MVRKLTKGIALGFLGLLMAGSFASKADALTYGLTCILSGAGCAGAGGSFGTLTLTDNGDSVDILVDLGGSGVHKVHIVTLNYDDATFDSTTDDFDTSSSAGVIENEDGVQADGYSTGYFDLEIPDPPTRSLGFEPYSDSILLTGFNLDPSHFDYLDSSGLLYGAVHVGNIACASLSCLGQDGGDSVWVGATRPGTPPPSVPEPASILLLGSGLTGLWLFGRKKN